MRPFIFGAIFRGSGKRVLNIEILSGDGLPWRRQVLYLPIDFYLCQYTKWFWAELNLEPWRVTLPSKKVFQIKFRTFQFAIPVLDVCKYFLVKAN